jgi:hypothetical protein
MRKKKIIEKVLDKELLVYLTMTRNNYFINVLDFHGSCFFRTSGGSVCSVKGYPRSKKRSKEVITVLSLYIRIYLKARELLKLGFIYRGGFRTFRYFLKRILEKRKGIIPVIFIGRSVTYPHGGCRAGRKRNMRSELKLRLHRKKVNFHNEFAYFYRTLNESNGPTSKNYRLYTN